MTSRGPKSNPVRCSVNGCTRTFRGTRQFEMHLFTDHQVGELDEHYVRSKLVEEQHRQMQPIERRGLSKRQIKLAERERDRKCGLCGLYFAKRQQRDRHMALHDLDGDELAGVAVTPDQAARFMTVSSDTAGMSVAEYGRVLHRRKRKGMARRRVVTQHRAPGTASASVSARTAKADRSNIEQWLSAIRLSSDEEEEAAR